MNTLLLLFAIPVAVIILSIVLQKILRCPILVAATFFFFFLIVAFAVFDSSFLIYVIIYTILAYVTAVLTRLFCNLIARFADCFEDDGCLICGNYNSRRNRNNSCRTNRNGCSSNGVARTGGNCNCNNNCDNHCDNDCDNANDNTNNGREATFTLTSTQAEPVLFLTNRNSNPNCNNWNIRNGVSNNNCCYRRR